MGLSLEYLSWKENLDLRSGATKDATTIDYMGFALSGRWTHWKTLQHGFEFEGQMMYGQAGLGHGKAGTLTNTPSNKITWWGLGGVARYLYAISATATLGAGPFVFHRQVNIPADPTGIEASTNAQDNFGLEGLLRVRLGDVEFQQRVAAVTSQNSTLWAFGLGFTF